MNVFFNRIHFFQILVTPEYIATLKKSRDVPYVYIIDNYSYDDIHDKVGADQIGSFIAELTQTIETTKAAALAFDYMNSVENE